MPPDPQLADVEDDYESAEDSDFAPDDAPDNEGGDSEDDQDGDDAEKTTDTPKRKHDDVEQQAEDEGFENSGDEAIIIKGQKKRKKALAKGKDVPANEDDDEGGEGGLVKTRRMRAQEKVERKMAAVTGPVTIDVDAMWEQMLSGKTTAPEQPSTGNDAQTGDADEAPNQTGAGAGEATIATTQPTANATDKTSSNMVRIKRTYNFAGQVHTEEKLVPRDSAEARLYFESNGGEDAQAQPDSETGGPPPRVLKKAFRSAFEPAIELLGPARSDLKLGMTMAIKAREKEAAAKKLNTVQKSKMDWAGFVDKQGLKDELDLAGRAKGSFNERQGFLARSEAKREEQAYRARMAGRT